MLDFFLITEYRRKPPWNDPQGEIAHFYFPKNSKEQFPQEPITPDVMDVFMGVHGVRRGKGEGERVGGKRKERGRRRRREGKEGGVLPYCPSRRRQLEKSPMPDVTLS